MKIVYVAGPYSAPTYLEREQNTLNAKKAAGFLARNRIGFFCPHVNSAHFDEVVGENLGHEYWLGLDFRMLAACDALYLLPGWHHSEGSLKEWDEAKRLGLPVFHSLSGVVEWSISTTE